MSCASSHAFGVTLLEGEAWSLSEAIGAPHWASFAPLREERKANE